MIDLGSEFEDFDPPAPAVPRDRYDLPDNHELRAHAALTGRPDRGFSIPLDELVKDEFNSPNSRGFAGATNHRAESLRTMILDVNSELSGVGAVVERVLQSAIKMMDSLRSLDSSNLTIKLWQPGDGRLVQSCPASQVPNITWTSQVSSDPALYQLPTSIPTPHIDPKDLP